MLMVRINDATIEEKIRSLASAHKRNVDDIVLGALATSMGAPEVLMTLNFAQFEEDPMEYMMPVAVPA